MGQPHSLGLMLDRSPVDDGVFELLHNGLVNGIALGSDQRITIVVDLRTPTKSSTVQAFFLNTTGVL